MTEFHLDMLGHEILRRAMITEAIPGWTEVEARADEVKAWKLLYAGLDHEQEDIYDMLVDQGVLPGDIDR